MAGRGAFASAGQMLGYDGAKTYVRRAPDDGSLGALLQPFKADGLPLHLLYLR